jgi:hypothetical protein
MMDQVTYLAWPSGSRSIAGLATDLACGGPYATKTGAEPIANPRERGSS